MDYESEKYDTGWDRKFKEKYQERDDELNSYFSLKQIVEFENEPKAAGFYEKIREIYNKLELPKHSIDLEFAYFIALNILVKELLFDITRHLKQ